MHIKGIPVLEILQIPWLFAVDYDHSFKFLFRVITMVISQAGLATGLSLIMRVLNGNSNRCCGLKDIHVEAKVIKEYNHVIHAAFCMASLSLSIHRRYRSSSIDELCSFQMTHIGIAEELSCTNSFGLIY